MREPEKIVVTVKFESLQRARSSTPENTPSHTRNLTMNLLSWARDFQQCQSKLWIRQKEDERIGSGNAWFVSRDIDLFLLQRHLANLGRDRSDSTSLSEGSLVIRLAEHRQTYTN